MNAASCYRLDFCSLVCDNDDQRLRHEQPKAGNGHDEAADGWKNQQAVSERQRCRSLRALYVGMHHLPKEEDKDAADQKPEWECLIVISHRCVYQSVLNDFQQCFFIHRNRRNSMYYSCGDEEYAAIFPCFHNLVFLCCVKINFFIYQLQIYNIRSWGIHNMGIFLKEGNHGCGICGLMVYSSGWCHFNASVWR